ncbi:MAG TPA: YggS family pyridoxal phosphate-dependent enzyme [Mycobacteriales bacterium]|nr:YggS family pyridoxal phosphate-dependent enzyme [Mycobacteriales bacterium]
MSRRDELAANLASTQARIAAACASAGRAAEDVVLVAVTKTWPASDVRLLAELGVRDVGENRDQEAREKHASCADLALRWHFVGQLQRNKVSSVATYADVVHSVDRISLVGALGRAATSHGRSLVALVQVSLDPTPDAGRGGAAPGDVLALAEAISSTPGLELGGVMAVAPLDADADLAFARLADVAAGLRRVHPAATTISAGMTGDLEAAIRHGATHVRVGTALLGRRTPPVG